MVEVVSDIVETVPSSNDASVVEDVVEAVRPVPEPATPRCWAKGIITATTAPWVMGGKSDDKDDDNPFAEIEQALGISDQSATADIFSQLLLPTAFSFVSI